MTYPNRIYTYAFLLLLLALFPSCNPQPEARKLLFQAEHFADTEQVDSGLRLIDSISYPEKSFDKEDHMRYLVTRVRLRYKGFRDIKTDTAVFAAWRYYENETGMPHDIALAAFYSGCVYREQGHSGKAMHAYSEAMDQALKTNDNELKGLIKNDIGDLLENQGRYRAALELFKASQRYWRNDAKGIIAISNIGRLLLLLGETDSAMTYFRKGVVLAEKQRNRSAESLLIQNIGVAYFRKKKFALALSTLKKASLLLTDSLQMSRYYLNFAEIYTSLNMNDSASSYYGLLKDRADRIDDESLKVRVYKSLSDWEKVRGNHEAAFGHLNREIACVENIMYGRISKSVLDMEKHYDLGRIKISHHREVVHLWLGLFVLFMLGILSGILFLIYRIRQKNLIVGTQNQVGTLSMVNEELNDVVRRRNTDLRKALVLQCGIAKKMLDFNDSIEKFHHKQTESSALMQRVNKIIYQGENPDKQYDAILHIINLMRPDFVQSIRNKYPDLSSSEIQICVLSYVDFKIQEIATVLDLKPNTVQTKRTVIRKKMGIPKCMDIADFIDQQTL